MEKDKNIPMKFRGLTGMCKLSCLKSGASGSGRKGGLGSEKRQTVANVEGRSIGESRRHQ